MVGAPEVVSRALRQVLALFEFNLVTAEFTADVDSGSFRYFDDNDFLLPVLAGSPEAWRVLRTVNLWQRTVPFVRRGVGTRPEETPTESRVSQAVIPICASRSASLYEHLVAGGISVATALPWILKQQQSVMPIERRQLKRAALRLFKPDYHAIKPKHGLAVGSHRQADFHASLRLLHGAALDGWITPDDWLSASNKVLKSSQVSIEWDKQTSFFKAVSSVEVRRGDTVAEFGTIFVLDDEEFWSEALEPMWGRYGISVRQAKTVGQLTDMSSRAPEGHARVILLDMRFGDRKYQGADFLRTLNLNHKGVPIIVLSVEDNLSVANLLRREGVFACISKQTSSEERGSRDEVSAFGQFRDAIILGLFASLTDHLADLLQLTNTVPGQNVESGADSLPGYIARALHAFRRECWNIYADTWEGTGRSRGLCCRQVIRALGLVNDKWCAAWTACQFDPDQSSLPWSAGVDRSVPYRTYHHITTQLRNVASHAIVRDEFFQWGDVWVMMLTLSLKVEGLHRTLTSPKSLEVLCESMDAQLEATTNAVWGLLYLAGYLDAGDPQEESCDFGGSIHAESEILQDQLFEWSRAKMSGIASAADLEQLAVSPYLNRHLGSGLLLHEMQRQEASTRTTAQLHADLLLLKLVNTRLRTFRASFDTPIANLGLHKSA